MSLEKHPNQYQINVIPQDFSSLISIEEYKDTQPLLRRIAESAKEVLKADLIELYEYQQNQDSYQLPQISIGERLDSSVEKVIIYKYCIEKIDKGENPQERKKYWTSIKRMLSPDLKLA